MKTVTFDETKWKLVPIEPTDEMIRAYIHQPLMSGQELYKLMIAAAPEYQAEKKTRHHSTPDWGGKKDKCPTRCFDFPNCQCTGLEP